MLGTRGAILFLTSGAVSVFVNFWIRALATRRAWLDYPNDRSAHAAPVPRLGGIGIVTGVLLVCGIARELPAEAVPILAAAGGIFATGIVDDLRSMSVASRLGIHVVAACLVVASRWDSLQQALGPLGVLAPGWLVALAAVVWIVWLTNLFNFMDGIDGLASGQAVIAGCAIAAAASWSGVSSAAALGIVIAGASLGFLVFNFPRAVMFMGDGGSTALGFLFACMPLLPGKRTVSIDVVGVALSLFVLDATVTLIRRVAGGHCWYKPHQSHLYQRPLAFGVTHWRISSRAYLGFAIVGTAAALMPVAATARERLELVAVPVVVFAAAVLGVRHLERCHRGHADEAHDRARQSRSHAA